VPVAERLRVRGDRIVDSMFVADMASFTAFIGRSKGCGGEA
jgi:hypothetical protein